MPDRPTGEAVSRPGRVLSVSQLGRGVLLISCANGFIALRALSPEIVRVTLDPEKPPGGDSTPGIAPGAWMPALLAVEETREEIMAATSALVVRVDRATAALAFTDACGTVISADDPEGGMAWRGGEVSCKKKLRADEHLYGLGERTGFLDKRGKRHTCWNTDENVHTPMVDALYQSQPFVIGLHGGVAYGLYFDNTWRCVFDLGRTAADDLVYTADGGRLDYYFILGPGLPEVVSRYTLLTGRMELPPLWALGYHQCRWSYYPQERVLALGREFRARGIPCDAIWLDIDYMDSYRVFSVDRERFPDFQAMARELSAMGIRVVAIVDPGVVRDEKDGVYAEGAEGGHFVRRPDGTVYRGKVWPGETVWPDFSRSATRAWWADKQRALLDLGVAGIWNDMNEPSDLGKYRKPEYWEGPTLDPDAIFENDGRPASHAELHNIYGLLMAEATRAGLLAARPDERPFILTRAGFAGIQRYAAVWTGDNHSWWEHLEMALPMLANAGLSGLAFIGTDIGGFSGDCDGELLVRWMQFGALSPFCRNHNCGAADQEPWAFGPRCEEICRRYIGLRYRLLPYLYGVFRACAETGLPVLRPLVLAYQEDEAVHVLHDQFLVGPDLMAAPVCRPGARHRMVYLPAGTWFDFWTGEKKSGPLHFAAEAPLEILPLYVRAGAVIPFAAEAAHAEEILAQKELGLLIYPGADGVCDLYEDDGKSFAYQRGVYRLRKVVMTWRPDLIRVAIAEAAGTYATARERLALVFKSQATPPAAVLLNGIELHKEKAGAFWRYDQTAGELLVSVPDDGAAAVVEVGFTPPPSPRQP